MDISKREIRNHIMNNLFIRFSKDKNCIRWHVIENDANSYKLASCGFNNQVTQIMGKTVFDEALRQRWIVRDQAEAV